MFSVLGDIEENKRGCFLLKHGVQYLDVSEAVYRPTCCCCGYC